MQLQQEISAERLKQKIGQTLDVIVDEIDNEVSLAVQKLMHQKLMA